MVPRIGPSICVGGGGVYFHILEGGDGIFAPCPLGPTPMPTPRYTFSPGAVVRQVSPGYCSGRSPDVSFTQNITWCSHMSREAISSSANGTPSGGVDGHLGGSHSRSADGAP